MLMEEIREEKQTMKLAELFANDGLGIMATAGADGGVNTAVYARPHVIDSTFAGTHNK